ncbi:MAG: type II toxin-antitoxin system VapC family toxin [Pseudomonadota bacterium]
MLIDTNVVSEAMKPNGHAAVKQAVARAEDELYLSVVVLGEIRFGVETSPDGRRKERLRAFYDRLTSDFSERIISVSLPIAERWAALRAAHRRAGRVLPLADGLIAATALEHDMPLMTRNTRDFELTGARLLNPWEE